jgi:hypothetical protein
VASQSSCKGCPSVRSVEGLFNLHLIIVLRTLLQRNHSSVPWCSLGIYMENSMVPLRQTHRFCCSSVRNAGELLPDGFKRNQIMPSRLLLPCRLGWLHRVPIRNVLGIG